MTQRSSTHLGVSLSFLKSLMLSLALLMHSTSVYSLEKSQAELIKAMQGTGYILMMRHENAPGFGDPDNIKVDDCSTQRNLDDVGRKNAKEFGEWLRNNNIQASKVLSSQWCRCLETARLLDMGKVIELTGLNSFFQMPETREPNLKALQTFIGKQARDKKLIIMVTHYVTIQAITGKSLSSGDAVLIKLNDNNYESVGIVSIK